MVVAKATAAKHISRHRPYDAATRRQVTSQPDVISMKVRFLGRRSLCAISLWGHPVCGVDHWASVIGCVAAGRVTSLSARRHEACGRLLHNGATPCTRRKRGVGRPFASVLGCNLVFRSRATCPLDNFLCCRTPLFSRSGGRVRVFGAQTAGWGLQSAGGDQIVFGSVPFCLKVRVEGAGPHDGHVHVNDAVLRSRPRYRF